jgi:hypothetical protein
MKPEEMAELRALNESYAYIDKIFTDQILALTGKALSLKIDEKERYVTLGGIHELRGMIKRLEERRTMLTQIQQKENQINGR